MSGRVIHGGPDAGPPITWDFSTNANAVPLPPAFRERLLDADRTRYPDPAYGDLRAHLARDAGTDAARIVPTSGSSEGIRRLTLAARLQGIGEIWVPMHAYADYAAAAAALRLRVRPFVPDDAALPSTLADACGQAPVLMWLCEPCNPTGVCVSPDRGDALMALARREPRRLVIALDRAYAPLRLSGQGGIAEADARALCWQCWSPNKALGLTGVRAGWIQAPLADEPALLPAMRALAPSWVLSAEGVRMLTHWQDPDIQHWLATARRTLADWLAAQQGALASMGWQVRPTQVPFFLARPPAQLAEAWPRVEADLRAQGIKLRDAASFGLPGLLRLRAHTPPAQRALLGALASWRARVGKAA